MSSAAALWSMVQGEAPDRKPELPFPGDWPRVPNPFGLALSEGVDLNAAQTENPEEGDRLLSEYVRKSKELLDAAAEQGAEVIVYTLFGANAAYCTPMQYGGLYLERDREILAARPKDAFTLLFVVGEADTYLDFVSDLPAEAFAWEPSPTGFTVAQVRALRPGVLAAPDSEADIFLAVDAGVSSLSALFTQEVLPTHDA